MSRRTTADRGAASILVVAVLGLLLLLGCALGEAAAIVSAHRRAQSAADLAALAGAQALAAAGDACARAGEVAAADGAAVASCRLEGSDVVLVVTVAGPGWLGRSHDLSAQARAGPAG